MEKKIYKRKESIETIIGRFKAVEAYVNYASYPDEEIILKMIGFEDAAEVSETENLKEAVDNLIGENIVLRNEIKKLTALEETVNSFAEEE